MNQTDILSLIPQRPPFVMIDQLINYDKETVETIFLVPESHVMVYNGELSEAGLTENIAQTAAAGSGYTARQTDEPVATGYIASIKNLEIFALPKIGDLVETTVTIVLEIFDATIITGTSKCNGIELAKCEMKIFLKK